MGMHIWIPHQTPPLRVRRDIRAVAQEVLLIANAVFVITPLPNLPDVLPPEFKRESSLEALNASFQRIRS